MIIRPFTIAVPDEALLDLRHRLSRARWPKPLDSGSWDDGASLVFLQKLVDHWQNRFNWRAEEARLNRLPQFLATIDDAEIHFVHKKGVGRAPLPLILTHGCPGSFTEFERIIPLLTHPGDHGADSDDAFDVVVPSLPGYGYSSAPILPGVGSRAIAGLWHQLMATLVSAARWLYRKCSGSRGSGSVAGHELGHSQRPQGG